MKIALIVAGVFIVVFLVVWFMGSVMHFGGAADDPNDEAQKEFVRREANERAERNRIKIGKKFQ